MARERILVGIDLGSSKIATIIGGFETGDEMRVLGSATVPSAGFRKGQVVDIEAAIKSTTECIEATERMAGYSVGSAYVSIDGPHIDYQNSHGVVAVANPQEEITPDDVNRVIEAAQAVSLPSSREVIHVLPRHFIIDSQEGVHDPVGMTGIRLEVETHIIHGLATTMRNHAKIVQELGIEIEGLVSAGLASAEAVLSETEKELGIVLIDLGGGTTKICVYVEGALVYSSVLPVGAKNVSNDLAIGLRLGLENAEKLKLYLSEPPKALALPKDAEDLPKAKRVKDEIKLDEIGIPDESQTVSRKTLIEGIIRPRLVEIFSYVKLELKKADLLGLTPAGVVLTGGGSLTVGAVDTCKATMTMPVRIGYPQRITGLIDEISHPGYATAVGLVLHGARYQEEAVSGLRFFPRKVFNRATVKRVVGKLINVIKSFIP